MAVADRNGYDQVDFQREQRGNTAQKKHEGTRGVATGELSDLF